MDGPYYAFKIIQRLRYAVPAWVPLVGFEGGQFNLVPVDFVARAIDRIAAKPGLDGRTFHVVDPSPLSVGDAVNEFCRSAHAPQFTLRLDGRALSLATQGHHPDGVGVAGRAGHEAGAAGGHQGAGGGHPVREQPGGLPGRQRPEGARRLRAGLPAPAQLYLEDLGLLGAAPGPGGDDRKEPPRRPRGQGGAGHGSVLRHRPGGGRPRGLPRGAGAPGLQD